MFDKLRNIQQKLKAPKNQRNNFGNYNYRSLEDIMEAVKPLLAEEGILLFFRDEIKEACGVPYVESSAIVTDGEVEYIVKASAGIDVNKKGMDYAQSFGASSSYARKYAANGLFLIDDTKDADATNTHGKTATATKKPVLKHGTPDYERCVKALAKGVPMNDIKKKYDIPDDVITLLNK